MDEAPSDPEAIVGDECHIIAKEQRGPRGGEEWPKSLDSYSNLILLCKVHHKLVDDQPNRFSSDNLRRLKRAHEEWIRLTLGKQVTYDEKSQPLYAWRLQTSGDIVKIISRAEAYQYDNPEPANEEEAELFGNFLQNIFDWGECWDDIGPYDRLKAQYSISEELRTLEEAGFAVFGTLLKVPFESMGKVIPLRTSVVNIVRANDPSIMELSASMHFKIPTST